MFTTWYLKYNLVFRCFYPKIWVWLFYNFFKKAASSHSILDLFLKHENGNQIFSLHTDILLTLTPALDFFCGLLSQSLDFHMSVSQVHWTHLTHHTPIRTSKETIHRSTYSGWSIIPSPSLYTLDMFGPPFISSSQNLAQWLWCQHLTLWIMGCHWNLHANTDSVALVSQLIVLYPQWEISLSRMSL